MPEWSPDVEIIAAALRARGCMEESVWSRVAAERAARSIPMQELLDWIYDESHGETAPIELELRGWFASLDRQKARAAMQDESCAFCGGPGGKPCDHRIGWQRSGRGDRDRCMPAYSCDVLTCSNCAFREESRVICPMHKGKPANDQLLTYGTGKAVHKQLIEAAERWRAGDRHVAHSPERAFASQGSLF